MLTEELTWNPQAGLQFQLFPPSLGVLGESTSLTGIRFLFYQMESSSQDDLKALSGQNVPSSLLFPLPTPDQENREDCKECLIACSLQVPAISQRLRGPGGDNKTLTQHLSIIPSSQDAVTTALREDYTGSNVSPHFTGEKTVSEKIYASARVRHGFAGC